MLLVVAAMDAHSKLKARMLAVLPLMKARALTFTTPPSIVEGDERTVCMSMTVNARTDTSNECKHHMSYIARLTGSC
jgi:hypothetical protein